MSHLFSFLHLGEQTSWAEVFFRRCQDSADSFIGLRKCINKEFFSCIQTITFEQLKNDFPPILAQLRCWPYTAHTHHYSTAHGCWETTSVTAGHSLPISFLGSTVFFFLICSERYARRPVGPIGHEVHRPGQYNLWFVRKIGMRPI